MTHAVGSYTFHNATHIIIRLSLPAEQPSFANFVTKPLPISNRISETKSPLRLHRAPPKPNKTWVFSQTDWASLWRIHWIRFAYWRSPWSISECRLHESEVSFDGKAETCYHPSFHTNHLPSSISIIISVNSYNVDDQNSCLSWLWWRLSCSWCSHLNSINDSVWELKRPSLGASLMQSKSELENLRLAPLFHWWPWLL